MIILKSSDDETFEIKEAVALQSQTIKYLIELGCADTAIPIPNVTSKILAKVIEYCHKHKEKVPTSSTHQSLKAWDAGFVDVDRKTLVELMWAANYLNIKGLMDLTFQTVADMVKGKTPAEVCKMFNIKEEQAEVRREKQSAFE